MANRLEHETSPYLRQHANNPVDWYPWGEEALRIAVVQNKPILLSIGYSACHWCHVMASESFEDPEIAAVMNRRFVNVKVDREERPDLDQIYQTAHHLLTQRSGGWPLTMFLTPDQRPFFGGTYFPKRARYGLPGFAEVLERVSTAFAEEAQAISAQNDRLQALLRSTVPSAGAADLSLSSTALSSALAELKRMFDPVHGGFGGAPKFPHPSELDLCLAFGARHADDQAMHLVVHTLRRMAEGGIFDQLGGGFCRYSVDAQWGIPHFEKMLYDNGPLLRLYADAWVLSGERLFKRVCEQTAAWVIREMQSPEGGYYSSFDADSEHREGKFYVWSRDAVRDLLSDAEYAVLAPHYGLDHPPNFEEKYWHLRVHQAIDQVASSLRIDPDQASATLMAAREKLWCARERRIRPGRDEKILTSWNALMIQGMARAGRVMGRPEWLTSAARATDFLRGTLWRNGRLVAAYKDGQAHLNAYLDDYAFLLAALVELMQAQFRSEDLRLARDVADALIAKFEDERDGGFFFTSSDHEPLILRPKPGHDAATPSGNGMAALSLQRLGHLTGDSRYLASAERTLRLFNARMQQHPSALSTLCLALADELQPAPIVIIRGTSPALEQWRARVAPRLTLSSLVISLPEGATDLPAAMDKPAGRGVNAWVCRGVNCLPPISDVAELERTLVAA